MTAGMIAARLDRLPATRTIWKLVLLLSLGGCFEYYDIFFTAYIGPGLVRSGLFSSTSAAFFGFTGLASFVAATFAGLLIGTSLFSFTADRSGRRVIFTGSLLWYSAATVVMAFQNTAAHILIWRMVAGIGIGVELVTIDTYIAELVPESCGGALLPSTRWCNSSRCRSLRWPGGCSCLATLWGSTAGAGSS
jgi:putative MFS transporter